MLQGSAAHGGDTHIEETERAHGAGTSAEYLRHGCLRYNQHGSFECAERMSKQHP